MKKKILGLLKDKEGYVSGQEISNQFGVSRTAIWKYIKQLKEEGYEIESVTRKGYHLLKSPDLLMEEEIRSRMGSDQTMGEIHVFSSIDSTNEEAKRAFLRGCTDRSLFVSDQQTAGKGRRGRQWISPQGKDAFFSILLKPDLPLEAASMITLVAALAGVRTVEKHADCQCQIKWPNDLVIHGKKICGILTEMSADMDAIHYIVAGIGFNLNRTEFDDSIDNMASSIFKETGCLMNRNAFVADFALEFIKLYEIFLREQDLSSFMEDYNNHLINIKREVRILQKNEEKICTALGINERGELLVQDESGKVENIFSGEVSVRGLYGYV